MLSALVLSIALAMDATAVAAARGLTGVERREAVLLPLLFGGFQAGMAALGWIGGRVAIQWVSAWDHWIAFGLLAALGGRMIVAALRGGDDAEPGGGVGALLVLAVATSIDAFAAGLTLEVVGAPPPVTLLLIGVVTAALSAAGYLAGRRLGGRAGAGLEMAGGLALIAIGAKILIEHLTAS